MATPAYSLQRRLAWRLGGLFLLATSVVTAGLFISTYSNFDNLPGASGDDALREALVHQIFREYFIDVVLWVMLPFVLVMPLVGYVTLARGFHTVSALSRQAAAI